MGAPHFKMSDLIRRHGIIVKSANFALYGDLSSRIVSILAGFTPRIEVYSIDESFLDLSGIENLRDHCRKIQETVIQWTGVPVSVGVGPTKTLAKLANRLAKKQGQVVILSTLAERETALKTTEINDVWGIGYRRSPMLLARGIQTAYQLTTVPEGWIRQKMGVTGLRTVRELKGQPCDDLEIEPVDKKTVCVSRSFGKTMTDQTTLAEAVATFADIAGSKRRKAGLVAGRVVVFIESDRFQPNQPQYRNSAAIDFSPPRASALAIHKATQTCLNRIYREGIGYKRAGVYLLDLVKHDDAMRDLFSSEPPTSKDISKVTDQLNARFGAGTIAIGRIKRERTWYMRQDMLSPHYTTRWSDIPTCRS